MEFLFIYSNIYSAVLPIANWMLEFSCFSEEGLCIFKGIRKKDQGKPNSGARQLCIRY